VRITRRRTGDEDTGFSVVIPIALPAVMTATLAVRTGRTDVVASEPNLLTPVVLLTSLPWESQSTRFDSAL
jgi:hypothetical protein